jgi:hypothetical protein
MNRPQRVVAVLYCLFLVYCFVWIPWRIELVGQESTTHYVRAGYGWLWSGTTEDKPRNYTHSVIPDLPLICLRVLAASAIAGAAMLTAAPRQKT